ncbi:MAG: acyl carrier protein [Desulfarculaceae bacterium]|nr:acyl carrier protein [Desulfarculaceae bacterium]
MVSRETIREKLIEQLSETTGMDKGEITEEAPFHEIGIDSLILVELFVFIEKEFKVDLMNSAISHENIQSVATLAAGIEETLKNR